MKSINNNIITILLHLLTSIRMAMVTMLVCCGVYTFVILGFGQIVTPETADGSLVKDNNGQVVGSVLIAQKFSRPEYFHPRPSAVDYNAAASGGSNLSPAGSKLAERSASMIETMGGDHQFLIPADLVTESGSGLDPHITLEAAQYQAERVANARGLELDTVMSLVMKQVKRPGGLFAPEPLVNVLMVNMELDRISRNHH
jgi:potassium-transporting ATPase KdpC subunit